METYKREEKSIDLSAKKNLLAPAAYRSDINGSAKSIFAGMLISQISPVERSASEQYFKPTYNNVLVSTFENNLLLPLSTQVAEVEKPIPYPSAKIDKSSSSLSSRSY